MVDLSQHQGYCRGLCVLPPLAKGLRLTTRPEVGLKGADVIQFLGKSCVVTSLCVFPGLHVVSCDLRYCV